MLIQLLKQRQKQHKLVIMADSSINFQFHYTVLGLLLHLVDCNAADLEDKSSFIRVSGSKRKYEESVVASMIASVSNDGGFSNSNDNVDHLNNNHNTIVLDTNCTLNPNQDHVQYWISYLLLSSIGEFDYFSRSDDEVSSIINSHTTPHITCAQFCINDGIFDEADEETDQCERAAIVNAMHVHRGKEGIREVQQLDVRINNRKSFYEWCDQYWRAFALDLRKPSNIKLFREIMKLEPSIAIEDAVATADETVDESQFSEMYYELIVDFQSLHRFRFSPMNNNLLMTAVQYVLLRASPDTAGQFAIGSLTIPELKFISSSVVQSTHESMMKQIYHEMLTSDLSPMNSAVAVKVHCLTANVGERANEVVNRLRQQSNDNIDSLMKCQQKFKIIQSIITEEAERFVMYTNEILPDDAKHDLSQDSSLQLQNLRSSHWASNDLSRNIMHQDSFRLYVSNPNLVNLTAFRTAINGTHGVSMLGKVTAKNIIMDSREKTKPDDRALDAREMNLLSAAPFIFRITYEAELSPKEDGEWCWTESYAEEVMQLIKQYCGTYNALVIIPGNGEPMLDNKRLAAMMILSLWEAAVTFNMQSSLRRCFTRITDSLASRYSSTITSNEVLIKQLGEIRKWLYKYLHAHLM